MKKLPILMILSAVAGCSPSGETVELPAPEIDVAALMGQDRPSVDAVLGTPDCHPEANGELCEYGGYNSAFFIGGKAATLTLPPVDDFTEYGLDLGDIVFQKGPVTRWETVINGKNAEVSSFPDYSYIQTREPF